MKRFLILINVLICYFCLKHTTFFLHSNINSLFHIVLRRFKKNWYNLTSDNKTFHTFVWTLKYVYRYMISILVLINMHSYAFTLSFMLVLSPVYGTSSWFEIMSLYFIVKSCIGVLMHANYVFQVSVSIFIDIFVSFKM